MTHEPLSASRYMIALSFLFEGVSGQSERALFGCAVDEFKAASGLLISRANPELASSIFNNAAISLLYKAETEDDFEMVSAWFERATSFRNHTGALTSASLSAQYNLEVLSQKAIL